jgi:hypothetical protein
VNREEAADMGLSSFVPDQPCRNRHWLRSTATGRCLVCRRRAERERYARDPEKTLSRTKAYHAAHRDERNQHARDRTGEARERARASARRWNAKHRAKLKAEREAQAYP